MLMKEHVGVLLQAIYKPLITLGKDVPASNGEYEFEASGYQCTGQDCFEYEVGLVEVKLQDKFTPTKNKYLILIMFCMCIVLRCSYYEKR
jgi:hypothetical protein